MVFKMPEYTIHRIILHQIYNLVNYYSGGVSKFLARSDHLYYRPRGQADYRISDRGYFPFINAYLIGTARALHVYASLMRNNGQPYAVCAVYLLFRILVLDYLQLEMFLQFQI